MTRPLIITGMHRSGTSLVASLLQQAGMQLGQNLIAPDHGNPRGHFEEAAFVQLHDQILRRLGQDILVQTPLSGAPNDDERSTAQQLIAQYNNQPLWGWKDPRTSLFLDFWHDLLPQARCLFIYRHPLEVTLSLLRRGTDLEVLADPLAALQSWQIYNQQLYQFYQQHPNQCVLVHIGAIVADMEQFGRLLTQKLAVILPTTPAAELYAADELRQNSRLSAAWSWRQAICPEAEAWYQRLNELADLPAPSEAKTTADLSDLWSNPTMSDSFHRLLTWLDPDTMSRQRNKTQQVINRWRQEKHALAATAHQLREDYQILATQFKQNQAQLATQQQCTQQLAHERDEMQQQLQAIQATKGWQWLQFYWRTRDWLKGLGEFRQN